MGVLKEALRNILDKEGMTIRLNPVDYDYMLEVNPRILNSFEGVKDPVFERDDSIEQGRVVVETLFGQVDARLDSQMREIQSAMVRKGYGTVWNRRSKSLLKDTAISCKKRIRSG